MKNVADADGRVFWSTEADDFPLYAQFLTDLPSVFQPPSFPLHLSCEVERWLL